jgi:phage terminase large subunit-like protein
VPEDAEPSIRRVKQANPGLWITPEQLREQRQRLPEAAFRRFVCNQWVEAENYWLPTGAWQACAGETHFEDGEPVVIGVDIGGERADSAVVWINEKMHVGGEILSGDRAVLEIADVVHELAERFTIVECAFDPWRAGQIGQELESRGIRVSAFPQHDARMIPASQRLYDAIVEGRLVHPNDPQLTAHVAAAIARHGRRGWRIDKANRSDKIDAVVALCMAVDRLEPASPDPTAGLPLMAEALSHLRRARPRLLLPRASTLASTRRATEAAPHPGVRRLRTSVRALWPFRPAAGGPSRQRRPTDNRIRNTVPLCRDCHRSATFPGI